MRWQGITRQRIFFIYMPVCREGLMRIKIAFHITQGLLRQAFDALNGLTGDIGSIKYVGKGSEFFCQCSHTRSVTQIITGGTLLKPFF